MDSLTPNQRTATGSLQKLSLFVDTFNLLRAAGELVDVTLVCENDQSVDAHKLILAACSPFFRKLFNKTKHTHPLIYLKGVQHQDLLAIIDYVYKGEANVDPADLRSFLRTATDLEIQNLTLFRAGGKILLKCHSFDKND